MMSLLDGGIKSMFGGVFSSLYLNGVLYRSMSTKNDDGDIVESYDEGTLVKVQQDRLTYSQRTASGDTYTNQDIRILILQIDANGEILDPISPDDQIEAFGKRWALSSITSDPAGSHWDMRGTPV